MHEFVVFYHIFKAGPWKTMVEEQLTRIVLSGLYNECEEIRVYAIGNGNVAGMFDNYPKIKVHEDSDANSWELGTLQALHKYAKENLGKHLLYIHTKGISRLTPSTNSWRKVMEHYCIDSYTTCIRLLAVNDMVGINLSPNPRPHYSGNFWWATSKYIATLKPLSSTVLIGPRPIRMNAEMWPASGSGRFVCLHYSGCNHYEVDYDDSNYLGLSIEDSMRAAQAMKEKLWSERTLPSSTEFFEAL
ncbi:MAG TPA: hypothetical protein VM260_10280 [Pirellula sp.]|nr:hypothetical protein [Pirellula sp.]